METPVHIEFQGMEPQEGLRVAIARHVAARWTGGGVVSRIRLAR